MGDFVLASASPRRETLLKQADLKFQIIHSNVEEKEVSASTPQLLVEKLALLKAGHVSQLVPSLPVLGADTVVVLGQEILGKPADAKEACSLLQKLQGKLHQVYTGVAVVHAKEKKHRVAHEITRVWMRPLLNDEIEDYVATGEPFDKAGAYGIQGKGGFLIDRIDGCYFNVVGLPLSLTASLLKEFGVNVLGGR